MQLPAKCSVSPVCIQVFASLPQAPKNVNNDSCNATTCEDTGCAREGDQGMIVLSSPFSISAF